MLYLNMIIKLVGCSMKEAETIMGHMDIDFSESSTRAINKEIRAVVAMMKAGIV